MYPILFSFGPVVIFSFSVLLFLAWLVFSFLFWRSLRNWGVSEESIFDLMFYSTLVALVSSRLGFVLLHWDLFADNLLKVAALWVQPGLSLYGAILGGMLTLVSLSRRGKVRLGLVLDSIAASLPAAILVGKLGSLLDGSEVGKLATLPWAIRYLGHPGLRHPVQVYEMMALVLILVGMVFISRRANRQKWAYGLVGVWFFALYSLIMFILEFTKDSSVYWKAINANQWILIGLFAESVGALWVRGGGKQALRQIKNLYAKVSQRGTSRDSKTS